MTPAQDAIADALTVCDREPIRTPGSIQPHGFLLALDPQGNVSQASENAAEALGVRGSTLQGSDLATILGKENVDISAAIECSPLDTGSRYLRSVVAPDGFTYQAIAHRHEGILVLEFEKASEVGPLSSAAIFGHVSDFMTGLALAGSMQERVHAAACEVRRLTGFDRVLVYRFDADWNGTVVAEDRNEELPLYLHLRFPRFGHTFAGARALSGESLAHHPGFELSPSGN